MWFFHIMEDTNDPFLDNIARQEVSHEQQEAAPLAKHPMAT